MSLVLASSSPYRRALLERLSIDFVSDRPDIDETRLSGETAESLVERLSLEKARVVGERHPDSLVIGSDQVLLMGGEVLGKPGGAAAAVDQLTRSAGRQVEFRTGLSLLNTRTGRCQSEVVRFAVCLRALTRRQLESYVSRDRPFDCAGGFKSEGLGIALFESMHGDDPTSLIGLPLIALVRMLAVEGIDVLGASVVEAT